MKYVDIFLLLGLIGLTLFGALGLHLGMQGHDGGCIAAATQGVDCPRQGDFLGFLTFHFEVFKDLSTVVLNENLLILLVTLILATIGWFLGTLFANLVSLKPSSGGYPGGRQEFFDPSSQSRLVHWLALHEKSPTRLSGRTM